MNREFNEGSKNAYDVYTLHVLVWKEILVAATSAETANAMGQVTGTPR